MKHEFIETENFKRFIEGIESLKKEEGEQFNSARMGLFYGSFGIGKTWAIERLAVLEPNGILFLRAEEVWTKSYLIKKIGIELGVRDGKVVDINEGIKEKLLIESKVIVVDEVDKLLTSSKHELLEIFRDLSDQTSCIIVFIGMEQSARKWQKFGHYYSRLRLTRMQNTCLEDIQEFCKLSEVEIEEDLIDYFFKKMNNLRSVKREIEEIEEDGLKHDMLSYGLSEYKELKGI